MHTPEPDLDSEITVAEAACDDLRALRDDVASIPGDFDESVEQSEVERERKCDTKRRPTYRDL